MTSYHNRYLHIDLDTQSWSILSLSEQVQPDYYTARGWDENGVPLAETLAALGVEYPSD